MIVLLALACYGRYETTSDTDVTPVDTSVATDTTTDTATVTDTATDTATDTGTATSTDTGPLPQCGVDTDLGSAEGDAVATGIAVGNEVQTQCGPWNLSDSVVSWTAPRDGTWHFDTVGSPSDTVVAVFDDGCFQALDCSQDAFGDWSESRLDLFAGDTVNLAIETSDTAGWVLNVWEGACVDLNLGGELSAEASTIGEDTTLAVPSSCFSSPSAPGVGNDIVFRWVAPSRGVWSFSTEGSGFDTVLSLRRGGCEADVEVCGDDTNDGTALRTYSTVHAWLDVGQQVVLAIGGYNGATGTVKLTVSSGSP
jgi:hypothetical protein